MADPATPSSEQRSGTTANPEEIARFTAMGKSVV